MRICDKNDLKTKKRLLCFDLDGTLSQHKSHLPQANKDLLKRLDAEYKVIMVGAGNAPRIYN
jgi:hydroxymethylpyrimidine pyrophosphatase-like HAD family hydrolase